MGAGGGGGGRRRFEGRFLRREKRERMRRARPMLMPAEATRLRASMEDGRGDQR